MFIQQISGLIIGFAVMLALILRSKLSAFPALLIGALITGLVGGLPAEKVVTEIARGFGDTMMKIGIVIGLGIMLGKVLEISGAAKSMAVTFLRLFGKGREELAMAGTGYMTSIAIFSDSGFIILYEFAKAVSYYTRKSVVGITYALAIGLTATHNMVPPTPGPLAVAEYFGVDIGVMIFYGMIVALPMMLAGVLLAGWVGRKVYQVPDENGQWSRDRSLMGKELPDEVLEEQAKNLPNPVVAFMPIVIPVLLILVRTVFSALYGEDSDLFIVRAILFLGAPYIAILIGIITGTVLLTRGKPRNQVTKLMSESLNSAGMIVFVTAGGGALGHIIRLTGIGDTLGAIIADSPMPILLVPFLFASLIKVAQGSSTVAILTAAAITAPMFASLDINPVLPALSACAAGGTVSHLNDSFFWVFAKMNGLSETETLWTYTLPKCIEGVVGITMVFILSLFL